MLRAQSHHVLTVDCSHSLGHFTLPSLFCVLSFSNFGLLSTNRYDHYYVLPNLLYSFKILIILPIEYSHFVCGYYHYLSLDYTHTSLSVRVVLTVEIAAYCQLSSRLCPITFSSAQSKSVPSRIQPLELDQTTQLPHHQHCLLLVTSFYSNCSSTSGT